MGIYEELQARGLIAQVTDEERIKELVNNGNKYDVCIAIGPMIRNARIILIKSVSAGTANVLNRSLILFAKNFSIFAAK